MCTPAYVPTGSIPDDWTIGAFGAPGTGNEFCETCDPCNIGVIWSYHPTNLTRYKVQWQNGQGTRGAAGTADGGFNYDMDCDFAFASQDSFEDQSGAIFSFAPFCTCTI